MRAFVLQLIVATCLSVVPVASQPEIASPAIDWMISMQNADGSYVRTTEIATATQSTAEALATLAAFEQYHDAGVAKAVDFVSTQTHLNTENLSRLINANQQMGNDVSALLTALAHYQNFDGGFGELPGYASTPLDTAFALIAMADSDYGDSDVVDAAIVYLINQQQADGSFVLSDNNESSNYITALCSIALQKYRFLFNVSAVLQAANDYLLAQQSPDTGWGPAWETAVVLASIAAVTTDSTRYRDAADSLRDQQLANGSWADDVFVTALAARALRLVENVKQPTAPADGTAGTGSALTISGNVIDADSQQPIAQARVEVQGSGQAVRTAVNGGFTMDSLVTGELTVTITHNDYQPRRYHVVAPAGGAIDLGTIPLYVDISRTPTTTISGIVTDADTGLPLAGARVSVVDRNISGLTDRNGQYQFDHLSGNQLDLVASAAGYFEATATVSVIDPVTVHLDFRMNRASASDLDIVDMHIESGIMTYSAFAEIEVDAILYNTGNADREVRMYHQVLDADKVIVAEGPVTAVPLGGDPTSALLTVPAGRAIETEIEWYNGSSPPGDYQIIAQAYDGRTGQLLAERALTITVTATNRIGGAAEFDPPIAQLAARTPVTIGATVRNTGNQPIEATALTARVVLNKHGYQSRKDLAQLQAMLSHAAFDDTRGMAMDNSGNLYVVNNRNNTVAQIAVDGTVSTLAEDLREPVDIDIARSGDIYILNRHSSLVRIDSAGNRTEIPTGLSDQSAIEALSDERVLITQADALYAALADGSLEKVISGGLAGPRDMVVNSDGDVFIASADDDSISRYANGTLSTFVAGINKPYGLAVDVNDDLIVTSYGDNSLLRVTADGVVSVIATGLSGPFDVLIDNTGHYIVSNSMSNQIVSIDAKGDQHILVDQTINEPSAAIYNGSGELFVGNSGFGNIAKILPDGSVMELAANIPEPVALLDSGDGGVEVLQADGSILHVSAEGARTMLATGQAGAKDFVRDPAGDGYFVLESSGNRITHQHADGQYSLHTEALLDSVRVMTASAGGDIYVLAGPARDQLLTRIGADYTTEVIAQGIPFSRGMTVDASGDVYITDYNARRVLKIDANGELAELAKTPFNPGAITRTASGEVLLAPFGGNTVYTLNPDGSLTERITLPSNIMYGLIEDSDGNLWVSDQNAGKVLRVSPANVIASFSVPSAAALQADDRGGVFVSTYGGIKYISSGGAVSNALSHDAIGRLYVVAFARDRNGDYWIPDAGSITYRFDAASNLLQRFTTLKSPTGMITDANGNLVVTNGNNTIVRVRRRGALPEVITTGNFRAIAGETADTALVSSGRAARRLHLVTGDLSPEIPYSSTTLSSVEAIAVQPGNGFVLADRGHNRLHFYDSADREVDVQVGLVNPRGLTQDRSGRILVANEQPRGIAAVRDDRRADAYLYDFNGFDYLLSKADGNIYAASRRNGAIFEYDQRKRRISTLSVPESAALVIDANGDLLSTMPSQGALIRVASDGSGSFQRLASGLSHAVDVESDSAGEIYVTDSSRNTLLKLNGDGSLSLEAANIQDAGWLAFTPNGDKLVTYATNRLVLLEADGSRIELPLAGIIEPDTQFGGLTVADDGAIHLSTSAYSSLLKVQARVTEPDIQTGQVVYSTSALLDRLAIDGQVDVEFGEWTPSRSGEYRVEITADDGITGGTLMNTLHVGAQAEGRIIVADTAVRSGDQVVSGVLTISGAEPTTFTQIDAQNLTLAARTFATLGRGIAADSQGNVYASDWNKIVKVTPDGAVSDFVTGINEGISMSGIVMDNTDTLFMAANNGSLLKITPDGNKSGIGSFPSRVEAAALDYDQQLYAVTSAGRLYRVDKTSGAAMELPAEGLHAPRGMTIDAYGNIYVLNRNTTGTGTDPIIRIAPDGSSTNFFDYANFEFEGIPLAADCSNNLLFAPIRLPPFKYSGEEDIIVQLIGETGEVNQILHGPSIASGLGDIDVIAYDRFANRLLFYTDWNDGEIFAFPIVCGGIAVEAHLVTRSDVDLSSTEPAPSRIVDRSDGTREYVWQLAEVDSQGLAIQLNLLLRDLAEGEHRPIFSEAYLEFSNSFDPDTPVQVAMDIPAVLASSRVSIATRVDAAQYEADALVDIAIEVSNDSAVAFDGSVELRIVDAAGFTVATLPAMTVDALPPRSSLNLASVWNTGITLAGDYAVVAELKSISGEILGDSEAGYHIQAGSSVSPVITASVNTNKTGYSAWDRVAISGRVRNTSSNTIQHNMSAALTVTDSSGAVVHSETVMLNALFPGSYRDISSSFDLVDAAAGRYRVTLVGHDAVSGAALAQTEYGFDVERIISHGLTGSVQVQFRQLDTTEANSCTETITNLSGTAINSVTIRHLLVDIASGMTLTSNEQMVDLAAGATLSIRQTVTVERNRPGAYACVLQIDLAGDRRTLATAGFEYTEPENLFDIDISLDLGDRGRLLVLLDPPGWWSRDHADQDDDEEGHQHDSDRDDDDDEEGDDNEDESERRHDRHPGHHSVEYQDKDPRGPAAAPLLSTQRDFMANLLQQAGWAYTLVDSADAFTRAMRSGAYSAYALFSEQIRLDEQVQRELVAAVYRGEGLLLGDGHDAHNEKLRDALGIEYHGKHRHAAGIELTDSLLHDAASALFGLNDERLRIATAGAEIIASYTGIAGYRTDDDHDKDDHDKDDHDEETSSKPGNAAITRFSYGNGVGVWIGFDVLAELAGTYPDEVLAELLINALADIDRAAATLDAGGLIPIELHLANNGPATVGQLSLTWPQGMHLLDATPPPAINANTADWLFDLAIYATAQQALWLQPPPGVAAVELDALLQVGVGPSLEDVDHRQWSRVIAPMPTLAEIEARLKSLSKQHRSFGRARKEIGKAIREAEERDFEAAIKKALKAIDKLDKIDSQNARSIHMDIARAIRVLAMQWTPGARDDD